MPRKSKYKLQPLNLGKETLGQRIAGLRKGKAYTQLELAEKIGIDQNLISDYELDKIRPYPEMLIRFAFALNVTTDELLGIKAIENNEDKLDRKIILRMKKIQDLPFSQQKFLLRTIDSILKGIEN